MKVAIITAGQPRFTRDFITVLNQLKGFNTADLYMNLWESDWVSSVEEGISRVNKILPEHIKLKKLQFTKEPERQLPNNIVDHNNLKWWYVRRIGQIHCLKMAFDLIEEAYDVVVRVRLDGCLRGELDVSTLDIQNKEVVFCQQLMGEHQTEPNDQFFVGTYNGIKFLCNLYNEFDRYMIESCPAWEEDVHRWALEYIIGTYFKLNNHPIHRGPFDHVINVSGKSAYTVDKHTHLQVTEDPTL